MGQAKQRKATDPNYGMQHFNVMDSIMKTNDPWDSYKEMVDSVYFHQKTRSTTLDRIHSILNDIGEKVKSERGGQEATQYVEYLCQQMKLIVFLSWDTKEDSSQLTNPTSDQAKEAMNIKIYKGLTQTQIDGIKDLICSSFFKSKEVYHYLN